MTLSDVSIKRPVFTIMVSVAIVVLGIMGLLRLGVNLFPDVEFPIVTVTTVYPGASPAELESQVSQHIEDAIVSVPGREAHDQLLARVGLVHPHRVRPLCGCRRVRRVGARARGWRAQAPPARGGGAHRGALRRERHAHRHLRARR
ncbi:MAG: efflux RND transporter permease subunit [Sandaracinaceae bacterium]|nr:efflux RND transporter permease subunit [Sandaracinaceae bacterium]